MKPIVYIDGYSSSDTSNTAAEIDRMFLDVGELNTVAMIEVKLTPEAGSVPLKQYATHHLEASEQLCSQSGHYRRHHRVVARDTEDEFGGRVAQVQHLG